ncbi:ABC transporter ATP-binding protein [Candidatus Woesearchaeota archaeon]|nr:ABC transporter ATP-binding protein [Candidatus Woesearchaeota archaeon]
MFDRTKKRREINFKYNFKVYWEIVRDYKALLIFTLITALLIEFASIIESYIFKEIIDRSTNYTSALISYESLISFFLICAVIFVITALSQAIFRWLSLHYINLLDANSILDLKQKFFNHLAVLSHKFHQRHSPGMLISILVLTVIVFMIYSFYIQNIQQESNLKLNSQEDLEKSMISDTFSNINIIKYFGKESSIKYKFSKISSNSKFAALRLWNYFRWMSAGQGLIISIGTLALLFFSIKSFLAGNISVGVLVFIYTIYGNIFNLLYNFVYGVKHFYHAMADFETLFKYNKIKNEIKNKINSKELIIKSGNLDFKNVYFSFRNRKIFSNFNLSIKKNESVAIVGPSGSGKTTLIKLLYRFFEIQSGEILIDGKSIRDFKQDSLRSELSIVPQECVLFNDTISNNIAFSNSSASKSEIQKAIRLSQLDKTLSRFPLHENTIVGERGAKLSGGERQRISIARAILADKKILILDEATSALDSQTESDIQISLDKLLQNRTSIIIAHRLSTIMKADRIIVLDKGKIVQMGRHEELIKQSGLYRRLWTLQKGGYIN